MTLLKELRTAAGDLTQVDLANESGVGLLAIKEYERGKFELSDSDLEKISFVIASRLQLAYVAGLFDRASTWNIAKVLPNKEKHTKPYGNSGPLNFPNYSPRIRFTTKHKILAKVLEQAFGVGFVHGNSKREEWTFFVASKKARDVAEELLPYLVLKRREANLIIELSETMENSPIKGGNRIGRFIVAHYLPSFTTTVYNSREAAAEALNINVHSINGCLQGKQHNTKNNTYTFTYGDFHPPLDKTEVATEYMAKLESLYQQMADLKVKADGTKKKQRRKPSC